MAWPSSGKTKRKNENRHPKRSVLAEVKRRVAGATLRPTVVAEVVRLQFEAEFSRIQLPAALFERLSMAQSLTLSAIVARPDLRIIPHESVVLILRHSSGRNSIPDAVIRRP